MTQSAVRRRHQNLTPLRDAKALAVAFGTSSAHRLLVDVYGKGHIESARKILESVTQKHLKGYAQLIPPAEQIAAIHASTRAAHAIDQLLASSKK